MAKKNSLGWIIVVGIVIGMYLWSSVPERDDNIITTKDMAFVIKEKSTKEQCEDTRDEYIADGYDCVGDCVEITYSTYVCELLSFDAGDIGDDEIGDWGFFARDGYECDNLPKNDDNDDWYCLYDRTCNSFCSQEGERKCVQNANAYGVCEEYDEGCLDYDITNCGNGETCEDGACVGGDGEQESGFVGNPTANKYEMDIGDTVSITQNFYAAENGYYFLEAGMERTGAFTAFTISTNQCNPKESWYANQNRYLYKGEHTITFVLTPVSCDYEYSNGVDCGQGNYHVHTAWVSGCAGSVYQQKDISKSVKVSEGSDEECDIPGDTGECCEIDFSEFNSIVRNYFKGETDLSFTEFNSIVRNYFKGEKIC